MAREQDGNQRPRGPVRNCDVPYEDGIVTDMRLAATDRAFQFRWREHLEFLLERLDASEHFGRLIGVLSRRPRK